MNVKLKILLLSFVLISQGWSLGFITTGFWQNTPPPAGLPVLAFSNLPLDNAYTANLNVSVGGANVLNYRYKLGLAATTDCTNATGYSAAPISIGLNITDDLSGLTTEDYKLCGIGINGLSVEQDFSIATEYVWTHFPPVRAIVENPPAGGIITNDYTRLDIGGTDVDRFRYKVGATGSVDCTNAAGYSDFRDAGTSRLLDFSVPDDGPIKLCLIGMNPSAAVQAFADATEYTYTKDAPVQFNFTTAAQSADEGSGNLVLQVNLKRRRNVAVNLSIGAIGNALENTHFSIPVKSFTIPSGSLSTNVTVDIQSGIPNGEDRILQVYADHYSHLESYPGEVFSSNIMIKDTNVVRSTITEVAMKYSHSCVVRSNGTIACWGTNTNGQVGDGTSIERGQPVTIAGTDWRNVSVGSNTTCALKTDNTAHCWGLNTSGQVGTGSTTPSFFSTPQPVTGGHSFSKITSIGSANCGLTLSKKIFCWGIGSAGRLGDGTNTNRSVPTAITRNDLDWKDVAGGNSEFCALEDTSGDLYCWGWNEDGLINQTYNVASTPYLVDSSDNYKSVKLGQFSGCVINQSDELKCWGANYGGEAMLPDPFDSPVPVHVDTAYTYRSVALGIANTGYDPHGCGVTTTNQVRCWGTDNTYSGGGALGRRPLMFYERNAPANVDTGSAYDKIVVGQSSTCGILTNGDLRCFGSTGVTAIPSPFTGVKTTPTDILPHLNVKSIEAPGEAACRIDSDDKLYCIGTALLEYEVNRQWTKIMPTLTFKKVSLSTGFYGGSGYGCAQDSTDKLWCWNYEEGGDYTYIPTEVAGVTVKDFAVSQDTLCYLDLTNKILCKGSNASGNLGNGTDGFGTGVYTFNEILGGRTYKKLSGGNGMICAIDSVDQVYCWGTGGTLGNGTTVGSGTPTLINDATAYASLSTRNVHCGITTAGILKCWGYNMEGQVGNSRPSGGARVLSPAAVTSADTFSFVAAGSYETACAINSSSKLFCWGTNRAIFGTGDNRLGTGSTANNLTVPTAVDAATDYQSVTAGYSPEQQCGITTGQKLKCWGKLNETFYYDSYANAFGFDHGLPYTVPGLTGN